MLVLNEQHALLTFIGSLLFANVLGQSELYFLSVMESLLLRYKSKTFGNLSLEVCFQPRNKIYLLIIISGVIAHKTLCMCYLRLNVHPSLPQHFLARQQFGLLQAQTFPTYFLTTLTYTSVLLSMWIYKNLDTILSNLTSPSVPAVTQTYCLLFIVGLSLLNWLYIGPTTHGYVVSTQS